MSEKGFEDMIREIVNVFFRVTGVAPTAEHVQTVETEIRQQFAGDRIYIAGQPKRQRARQLAKLAQRTTRELSLASGLSERHVRRLMRGK